MQKSTAMKDASGNGVLIFGPVDIDRKIKRMAYQIYEANFEESELVLAGIIDRGNILSDKLGEILKEITGKKIIRCDVFVNKQSPLSEPVTLDNKPDLSGKTVILIDDVLNTGSTLFYAQKPFLDEPVKKLQTLVLVHRSHNNFPVTPDFNGVSLATTLQEHIFVELDGPEKGIYIR
jgi:pyrimidine operon attenuation protein / uracil phosphoribosyltransferase